MTSIFIVHSVLAVPGMGKVSRERNQQEKPSDGGSEQKSDSFSQILQQEVEVRRTDSINCHTVTYGMDRRLHHFDYRANEYLY